MLAFWVIGAILIVLGVIGLAGALVIRPIKVSKISENSRGRDMTQVSQLTGQSKENQKIINNYYPGVIQMLRMARTGPQSSGRDAETPLK